MGGAEALVRSTHLSFIAAGHLLLRAERDRCHKKNGLATGMPNARSFFL
jgi:hypothetical protein